MDFGTVSAAYKKKAMELGYSPEVGVALDHTWKGMLYGGFVWGLDDQPASYWYNLAEGITIPTQKDVDLICLKFDISKRKEITKEDIV